MTTTIAPPADVLEALRKRAISDVMSAAYEMAHVNDEDSASVHLALKRMRSAIEDQRVIEEPEPDAATLKRLAASEVSWVAGYDGEHLGTTHEKLDEMETRIKLQRKLIVIRERADA